MKNTRMLLAGMVISSIAWSNAGYADSLSKVLVKALSEHPQAQAARSRLLARQESVKAAKASYFPTLALTTGIGQQRKGSEGDTSENNNVLKVRKEASLAIRQNLFSGFGTISAVQNAEKQAMAEQWRLRNTYDELALRVIDVYLKVLERRDQLELAEKNLKLHHEIYEQIKQRTAQGVARQSDLAQIEGRRARANANIISARNNLMDSESEYFSLVGVEAKNLEQPGSYNLPLPGSLEEALQVAKANNPGLKAAELDTRSARDQYKELRAAHFPTLDFEMDRSWRHNADGALGVGNDMVAMLRMRYNLFNGGGDQARLQESAYKVEENLAQKERAMRSMEERLRIAWAALMLTGQQKHFLALHEKSSEETVAAYQEQFNIGKRTLLDLLDGENELFQSSGSLISAVYQEAFARYRVLAETGRLLGVLNITVGDGTAD